MFLKRDRNAGFDILGQRLASANPQLQYGASRGLPTGSLQYQLAEQKRQKLMDEQKKAFEEAKAANESRYQDILGGYNKSKEDAIGTIQAMGAQERADIEQNAKNRYAQVQQDTTSRGLTGTTILPTLQAGVNRDSLAEQGRLADRMRSLQVNTQMSTDRDRLGFMERREDVYPDMSSYMNLMSQYGNTGMPGAGYDQAGGLMQSQQPNIIIGSVPGRNNDQPLGGINFKDYKGPAVNPGPSQSYMDTIARQRAAMKKRQASYQAQNVKLNNARKAYGIAAANRKASQSITPAAQSAWNEFDAPGYFA